MGVLISCYVRRDRRAKLDVMTSIFTRVFGRASPKGRGIVVGGLFGRPHFSLGYARAARIVLDFAVAAGSREAHDLVPPIFFLARHAIELALKDLLLLHQENVEAEHLLHVAERRKPRSSRLQPPAWQERIHRTHHLDEVIAWVERDLGPYVTKRWRVLVRQIIRFEGKSPEWSRYAEVSTLIRRKNRKPTRRRRRTFCRRRLVPVQTLVERLEAFMKEAAVIDVNAEKDESALQWLEMISNDPHQKLYARG